MDKATLERRLSGLAGFDAPRTDLEQYPTPAWLAAHLVHLADLAGDLGDRRVVDLGTGTGVLALAAATRGPRTVVGVEIDPGALRIAQENAAEVPTATRVQWVRGDATRPPLAATAPGTPGTTVLMNPPFGAQRGNEHADRGFLAAAAKVAAVSYSVHNDGSRGFVEAFAADRGGEVTRAIGAELALDRQFPFHGRDRATMDVEVFRIEW